MINFQDVVEIMNESLYDKYVDEHGFVDFGRSGGMSQQKEAKRFLSELHKQSESQQKDCFSISVSHHFVIVYFLAKVQVKNWKKPDTSIYFSGNI